MCRLLAVLLLVPALGFAQEKPGTNYAFRVSCGEKYNEAQLKPLPKSFRDMDDYRTALLATGFDVGNVVFLHDRTDKPERLLPEKDKIMRQLKLLLLAVGERDTLVVALNGHGLHFKGDKTSYFCPLNAKVGDKATMIPMDGDGGLFPLLKTCKAKRKLLIVGACRNDPAAVTQAAEQIDLDLLDPDEVPEGIVALYSCKAGQKTYFEEKQDRSYFFDHLVRAWQGEYHPGEDKVSLEAIFDTVKAKTSAAVRNKYEEAQVPEVRREYQGEWLVSRSGARPKVDPRPKAEPSPTLIVAGGDPKAGEERDFEIAKGVTMRFCWVPAGKATLGSPAGEKDRAESEEEHEFTTKGLWLGKYEVQQSEWEGVMGENPSKFRGATLPVEMVSWEDCQKFIGKCKMKGLKVKLPHEDEWEYACRGGKGNKQAFYWGDVLKGDKANHNGEYAYGTEAKGDYKYKTTKVGSYEKVAPHPWGLCDMSGNAYEWCENLYTTGNSARVVRGGGWGSYAWGCRSAHRDRYGPTDRDYSFGFRLALVP